MNSECLDVKYMLEWYLTAGVDETLGEVPFAAQTEKHQERTVPEVVKKIQEKSLLQPQEDERRAITALAQATIDACKNAREMCAGAKTLDELRAMVEAFDGCALKLTATKTVFGGGNPKAKVMFIGEAPGADEDRAGIPFVGRSGMLLDKIITAAGMKRDEVYITNVLPWRPPGNRTPTTAEVAICLPFLKRQIELVEPEILVLLGGSAANALLENEDSISKMRGKWMEYKTSAGKLIPVMATFHPAYLLRNVGQKAKIWVDFIRLKKKIL